MIIDILDLLSICFYHLNLPFNIRDKMANSERKVVFDSANNFESTLMDFQNYPKDNGKNEDEFIDLEKIELRFIYKQFRDLSLQHKKFFFSKIIEM